MRELVLAALMNKPGEFVSGQGLCETLGCTRANIWKIVTDLRADGYRIEAVPRRGYRLRVVPDIIEPYFIRQLLKTKHIGREMVYLKEVDSTNARAKLLADHGAPHGTLVLADAQIQGRGRLGTLWESRPGQSILMSLVLRPDITVTDIQKMTMMAAVAAVRALQACHQGIKPGIKWPNDILIGGKKVCGILTELSTRDHVVEYAVLGLGINCMQQQDDWPDHLRGQATSMYAETGEAVSRVPLIVEFCNAFEEILDQYLTNRDFADVMTAYRPYSVTLSKEVSIVTPGRTLQGIALHFDDDGMLIVLTKEGKRERVLAGEVHVRGLMGEI